MAVDTYGLHADSDAVHIMPSFSRTALIYIGWYSTRHHNIWLGHYVHWPAQLPAPVTTQADMEAPRFIQEVWRCLTC